MQVQVCPVMGELRVQLGEQEVQVRQQMGMNNIFQEELEVLEAIMAEQVLPMVDIAVEPGPVLQAQVHAVALVVQVVQGHHVLQVVLLEVLIAGVQQPVNPV
jgi:hypothetical protein